MRTVVLRLVRRLGSPASETSCPSSADHARRIALDPYHDALARTPREELRTARPDLISLPAVCDPRLSRSDQGGSLVRVRRQLGELEQLAIHVPNGKPCRRIDGREWIGCRASRVMAVAHGARIARECGWRKSAARSWTPYSQGLQARLYARYVRFRNPSYSHTARNTDAGASRSTISRAASISPSNANSLRSM